MFDGDGDGDGDDDDDDDLLTSKEARCGSGLVLVAGARLLLRRSEISLLLPLHALTAPDDDMIMMMML